MEPTIAISALAKLIGLGMKGWSAIESRGFEEKDVAAIQTLLETSTSFASMRKPVAPTGAAQYLALAVRSSGQAVGRHQELHGKLLLTGGLGRRLAWPADAQRMVCLLDGLDEVSLGDQHLTTLFQKLQGKATGRHRFVVFSRPGAVPARTDLGDGVAVVRVQPFRPDQVERWIAGWNQLRPDAPPVAPAVIEELGLRDLVRTPILLFMVAFTWEGFTARRDPPSLAEIYESFFIQIAAGKAAADRDRHDPIAAASEALLTALKNQGVLGERAALSDAMLWLMARVAWEAQMLEQRHPPEALTRRHIDNLLQDGDFRIPTEAAHAIKISLVLALQSDLRSADHQILFGHQSFREFLVGRHWATQLHQIVRGSQRDWDDRTATLLGGRLLGEENKSLDFLMQLINAGTDPRRPASPRTWTDTDREGLVRWAQEVFSDENQVFGRRERTGPRGEMRLRDDMRAVLREAALAIGSLSKGSPGLHAPVPLTLRSMLAWFWLHSLEPLVIAPRANLAGASLEGALLRGADLDRATLDGADLTGVRIWLARLADATLKNADLSRASLFEVTLDGATLTGANLTEAELEGVTFNATLLDGACLRGARLIGCDLVEASLRHADLSAATLIHSILEHANLEHANLEHANLEHANLEHANLKHALLTGANLGQADLTSAHLDGADLTNASLVGTNFRQASLLGTRFDGARYDELTSWPEGFDPVAHGAMFTPSK